MDNLKGMGWMTLAMLAFALADMSIKLLAGDLPVGQVIFLLSLPGALIFAIWARVQGHRWFSPVLLMRPVMLRNGAEMLATVGFVSALALIPLSTLSAVIQANPLLVTLGAALFLGEKVGWRRWLAIFVGLFGVLLIIRPGTAGFDASIWLAVIAAIGLSLRDLATRPVPRTVPTTLLASYSFAFAGIGGLLITPFFGAFQPLRPELAGWLVLGSAMTLVAIFSITSAMRVGDISAVTPFRYTRLVFALVIAYFVFDERPDTWTLIGAGIVVASGIYTFWREAQLRRRAAA
jgi:drug/metabolite transporter (DMT)-like permease